MKPSRIHMKLLEFPWQLINSRKELYQNLSVRSKKSFKAMLRVHTAKIIFRMTKGNLELSPKEQKRALASALLAARQVGQIALKDDFIQELLIGEDRKQFTQQLKEDITSLQHAFIDNSQYSAEVVAMALPICKNGEALLDE